MVLCHVCGVTEPLATAEDHHKTPRAFGGTDDPSNRVWLCSSCHTRIHRIQGVIVKGQIASALSLASSIFPTNGSARGTLWELANEAARAELEAKESFSDHRVDRRVSLEIDAEVWDAVKQLANYRGVSTGQLVTGILRNAVRDLDQKGGRHGT